MIPPQHTGADTIDGVVLRVLRHPHLFAIVGGESKVATAFAKTSPKSGRQSANDHSHTQISWRQCTSHRFPKIWEHHKVNGNVSHQRTRHHQCNRGKLRSRHGSVRDRDFRRPDVLEPGLFVTRGLSCPHARSSAGHQDKTRAGRSRKTYGRERALRGKVRQAQAVQRRRCRQNSSTVSGTRQPMTFRRFYDSCSFVFVDGSHAYDTVGSDTEQAFRMVRQGGTIIWHPPCHSEVHQRKRQRDERSSLRAGQAMARIL